MKPLPTDPFAFQAKAMGALMQDILDPNAKGFERAERLRQILIQSKPIAGMGK